MNRRSFLALLGLAAVPLPTVAAPAPAERPLPQPIQEVGPWKFSQWWCAYCGQWRDRAFVRYGTWACRECWIYRRHLVEPEPRFPIHDTGRAVFRRKVLA